MATLLKLAVGLLALITVESAISCYKQEAGPNTDREVVSCEAGNCLRYELKLSVTMYLLSLKLFLGVLISPVKTYAYSKKHNFNRATVYSKDHEYEFKSCGTCDKLTLPIPYKHCTSCQTDFCNAGMRSTSSHLVTLGLVAFLIYYL